MWFVTQFFLWIICLVVAVNCQGGGGGGGGGAFGAFGILIICLPAYCCWRFCAGKPRRSNAKFVTKGTTNDEEKIIDLKLFQSGLWESQYFQYDKWHGPHQFQLSFDFEQSKVTGSGSDDIGQYTIDGLYSIHTRRMGLTKTYQYGTGNPLENLGHSVIIQVEWNRNYNQFEGKWYVRTAKFYGSGKFTLKSDTQQYLSPLSIYDKV